MIVTKVERLDSSSYSNSGGGERLPDFLLRHLGIQPRSAYEWRWDNDKFGVVVIQK